MVLLLDMNFKKSCVLLNLSSTSNNYGSQSFVSKYQATLVQKLLEGITLQSRSDKAQMKEIESNIKSIVKLNIYFIESIQKYEHIRISLLIKKVVLHFAFLGQKN